MHTTALLSFSLANKPAYSDVDHGGSAWIRMDQDQLTFFACVSAESWRETGTRNGAHECTKCRFGQTSFRICLLFIQVVGAEVVHP